MQTATGEMAGAITGAAVAVAEMVTGRGSATESHFLPPPQHALSDKSNAAISLHSAYFLTLQKGSRPLSKKIGIPPSPRGVTFKTYQAMRIATGEIRGDFWGWSSLLR